MKIILIGAPGCGKGTQASYICSYYKLPHISTSTLIKDCIALNNKDSAIIQQLLDEGKLISDEIVINLLIERLKNYDCRNGYLLDGFPRTITQAKAFENIDTIDVVLYINTDVKTILDRIKNRVVCEKCGEIFNRDSLKVLVCSKCGGKLTKRKDDNLFIFEKRLQIYNDQTLPMVNYYKKQSKFIEISNNNSAENTFSEIQKVLDNLR